MALDPKRTAVILLGASTFPKSAFQPSEAFSVAKNRIRDYFAQKLEVPNSSFLDLFDIDSTVDEIDQQISAFIGDRIESGAEDIFIYYVGHGAFTTTDNSFYLALKGTRQENPSVSALTIRPFAETIKRAAKAVRTFIILDCCFAASAGKAFMGADVSVQNQQLRDAFATRGVAILCAASQESPAFIVEERKITMFTESFNEALLNGDSSISNKYLSLRQIHELTYRNIQSFNSNDTVRPEIVTPIQTHGDISEIPHFENFAFTGAKYDIVAHKRLVEEAIMINNLVQLGNSFIDFVRNFDETETFNKESILLCSECNDLIEEKGEIDRLEYKARRTVAYNRVLEIIEEILKQNVLSKAS
ncbi:caspase family protein [Mucilaginibacter pedocola]|uniref:Caspase family p20 domain-containing protein n=1 Tax=Mucilaginibacter pedocola TaxID=1792845 RepID=A0A1S9PGB6_9SPHI|nr:caspase family protein [Mucilaginibacter pedocola]OOQ60001.1 hypothetical protein BC343_27105 [Mucilaginibacter pedocola]